jgi:hypothetical protein
MNKVLNAKSLFLSFLRSRNPETVYAESSIKNHLSAVAGSFVALAKKDGEGGRIEVQV